jgi:small subunit ribosomal protein S18
MRLYTPDITKIMQKPTQRKQAREPLNIDVDDIDYKNIELLRKVISNYAKILPAKRTGANAKLQRKLAGAVKRARFMALLAFTKR